MLDISNVTKVFNPGEVNEVTAVADISLHVPQSQFLVVIGGNGSGKSTLLNLVAGTFRLDTGTITISGKDYTKSPEHLRAAIIGRVFQDPLVGTSAGLTIEENFALAASRGEFRGLGRALTRKLRQRVQEQLALLDMGLENRLGTKVGLLSGGQRQAITILMAVLKRPEILLLDEHTAALDPRASRKILDITHKIVREQHLTTMMITHNLDHVLSSGDRTIMMSRGRIARDLDATTLKTMTDRDLLELFWDTQRLDA
jgi:putative ABC transport system ATP-binding protein